MSQIIFNEEKHLYTYEGIVVPSVTTILEILDDSYKNIPRHILDAAAHRGKVVHKLIELYCKRNLDFKSLTPLMWGYLTQFKKFLKENSFKVLESERIVFSKKAFYAGTLDLKLLHTPSSNKAIIDIKSNKEKPTHSTQTKAYGYALEEGYHFIRGCLYLTPKKYTFIEHKDDEKDLKDFLAAKQVFDFRKKHGL